MANKIVPCLFFRLRGKCAHHSHGRYCDMIGVDNFTECRYSICKDQDDDDD